MSSNKKSNLNSYLPLLLALIASVGMLVGYRLAVDVEPNDYVYTESVANETQIGRIEEVLRLIEARYVDSIDSDILLDAAITGIFKELDPHSIYISEEELEDTNDKMVGTYNGLGIETILYNDTLNIVKVLKNSPAETAELKYGDQITSINDSLVANKGLTVDALRSMLKPLNGQIKVTIKSLDGAVRPVQIRLERVQIPNVKHFDLGDDIGYISILRFSERTSDEFVQALEALQENNKIQKLILDLRDNPGGYLPEATNILNQFFIENERLLVYTEGLNSKKSEYKTTGRPFFDIKKLALLINQSSASASEIIAGALQDWDKAVIVGEPSFGKGLVQEQFKLSKGGAIRLTTARYFTPTGRYIQAPYDIETFKLDSTVAFESMTLKRALLNQGGITPDVTVPDAELNKIISYEYDSELAHEAFRIIRKSMLKPDFSLMEFTPEMEEIEESTETILTLITEQYGYAAIEDYESEVVTALYRTIVEQLDNETHWINYLREKDDFIIQSVEEFQKSSIFAENRSN